MSNSSPPTARIAVVTGSVEEARLLRLGCPSERLVRVPDALSGRTAVRTDQADGLALSAPAIRWMERNPIAGLTESATPFEDSTENPATQQATGGFAFRQEDRALLRAWNAELRKFLGSDEHRRLVHAFGFATAELPQSTSAHRKAPAP